MELESSLGKSHLEISGQRKIYELSIGGIREQ